MTNKVLIAFIVTGVAVITWLIFAMMNVEDVQRDRANWCAEQGGVPVMNKGWIQLCLQPEAVIRKF